MAPKNNLLKLHRAETFTGFLLKVWSEDYQTKFIRLIAYLNSMWIINEYLVDNDEYWLT